MCDAEGRITHIGAYLGLYLACNHLLWPRFREPPEAFDKVITWRVHRRWDAWGKKLKARCNTLGLPFVPRKKGNEPALVPLAKLGIRKAIVIPPTPPARRRSRRR